MACPLCGHLEGEQFLERRDVPVLLNAPQADRARAQSIPRGDLALWSCNYCGFVHNSAFDGDRIRYAQDYVNNQEHSPQFVAYLQQVVARQGEKPGRVLEIGCGRGAFLKQLCAESDAEGWGFDTTYEGPATVGRARFFCQRYAGELTVDRVISRHVLEHVPIPMELLRLARQSLSVGGRLFIEVPDLDWILEHVAFWDFFYEHVGYFSPGSLRMAAEAAGFSKVTVTAAFGGQYLWLEGEAADVPTEPVPPHMGVGPALERFQQVSAQQRDYWEEQLQQWSGRVAVWGAGAKGVTFANLLDPHARSIRCLIDIHPGKQGLFIPGSAHPILAPDVLSTGDIDHVIVTNPNYLGEIRSLTDRFPISLHVL